MRHDVRFMEMHYRRTCQPYKQRRMTGALALIVCAPSPWCNPLTSFSLHLCRATIVGHSCREQGVHRPLCADRGRRARRHGHKGVQPVPRQGNLIAFAG